VHDGVRPDRIGIGGTMKLRKRSLARVVRILGWTLGALVGLIAVWLIGASIVYSPRYVWRVLVLGESDQGDYLEHFATSPLHASPTPFVFESAPEEERVRAAFGPAFGVDDLDSFLSDADTQAFIVIQHNRIIYERYFNGAARDTMLTSFSVAKSFDSALIGMAIDEGFIGGVDDPIADYLPELVVRDARFEDITIRHLLLMASGLDFKEMRWALFNGDDPITTYFPDQRKAALEYTSIAEPPGQHFFYNKYHPQLLGMILERATGMSVTDYTQTRLWDPLGMEYDGAWALDHQDGFEKMEAGLNARAIDYAKLGRLYLEDGMWNGTRLVSSEWVEESTALDATTQNAEYYKFSFGPDVYADGRGYYKYMWYGLLRDGEQADFTAEGDHGQQIYVPPAHDLVIVRNGTEYGIPWHQWIDAFYAAAGQL
jgi:CubicO group peptidase (beta-lactamase class C family)